MRIPNLSLLTASAVALLTLSCSTLPPKPQTGGRVLAEIPFVAPPMAVQGVGTTAQLPTIPPVRLNVSQGENQAENTVSAYTRETTTKAGDTTKESFTTTLGTNQHDKARDEWGTLAKFEAKLKSYGSIKAFGFVLVLLALGMFYPPVRAFTGSTIQVATGATGVFFIFGSQIIAGNEKLVLGIVVAALVGLYFFRRHGYLQGMVDSNKNGIPDRLEGKA